MRNLFLVLLLVICVPAADCWAGGPKHNVQKGNLLYNKGEFSQALKEYESALLSSADSDIVNYNTGAALYKTEKYQTAIDHFEKALLSEDKGLEQKASYNAGNAQYKYSASRENSDLTLAINLLKQSLRHYERAIALDAEDKDAQHNYEFVKKELERLQKKQQQQKQQQQQQTKPQQDKQQPAENNKQQQQNNPAQDEKQQDKQEKQDKQNEQYKQDKQDKSEEPQSEQQKPQSNQNAQPTQEEMSEHEARMLLDNYHQEEEPKELYKEKMPVSGLSEPLKDW